MRLNFEKTRGTRTIYFPLEKSPDWPSDFVVVVRPFQVNPGEQFDETDEFEAGIAFCNPADQFVKRKGRSIAFERLNSPHRIRGSAQEIIDEIMERVIRINKRRDAQDQSFWPHVDIYVPDMDETAIELDLNKTMSYESLAEYFLKKEENRKEMTA